MLRCYYNIQIADTHHYQHVAVPLYRLEQSLLKLQSCTESLTKSSTMVWEILSPSNLWSGRPISSWRILIHVLENNLLMLFIEDTRAIILLRRHEDTYYQNLTGTVWSTFEPCERGYPAALRQLKCAELSQTSVWRTWLCSGQCRVCTLI